MLGLVVAVLERYSMSDEPVCLRKLRWPCLRHKGVRATRLKKVSLCRSKTQGHTFVGNTLSFDIATYDE